jgi:hypothetical protein
MSLTVLPGVLGQPPHPSLLLLLLLVLLLLCCCYLANVDFCQVKEECPRLFCLVCGDTPHPFAVAVAAALLLLFN